MLKTKENYQDLTNAVSMKSKWVKNSFFAFLIGGLICTIGQCFIYLYEYMGVEQTLASLYCSLSLILISGVLTGLNQYNKIAKIGGAGTLVPITGFANAVVSPALEFKTEGFITGLGAKIFVIAGPVITYGVIASVIYGVIIFIFKLY